MTQTGTAPPEDRLVRPFADTLTKVRNGKAHDELSEALHDLLGQIAVTGKGGSITLVLTVEPMSKGDGSTVVISDAIRVKRPAVEQSKTIFFVDDTGNLTRHDPRQMSLPLREVPRPDAPLQEAQQ